MNQSSSSITASILETEIIIQDEDLSENSHVPENPYCALPRDFAKRHFERKEHFSQHVSSLPGSQREHVLRSRKLIQVVSWDGRDIFSMSR